MATDSRRVEWPPSRKHSILIRLTLLCQQVRNVIMGPIGFIPVGLCFLGREK
jgi:hypothetical protein